MRIEAAKNCSTRMVSEIVESFPSAPDEAMLAIRRLANERDTFESGTLGEARISCYLGACAARLANEAGRPVVHPVDCRYYTD